MFDEFLEDYKYNWKMADKQYMEERYRESLSPKQREKAKEARPLHSCSELNGRWKI